MYRNLKIRVGKDGKALRKHLVSLGHSWGVDDGRYIFISDSGTIVHGYDDIVFKESKKLQAKLVETVSYSLEEVKQREKICIGGKEYYLDELTKALENIKPIEND